MAGLFVAFLNFLLNNFNAFKVILIALFTTVLPVIFYNAQVMLYEALLNALSSLLNSVGLPSLGALSYSGLAGWFLCVLRIPEVLSLIATIESYRLTIKYLEKLILR